MPTLTSLPVRAALGLTLAVACSVFAQTNPGGGGGGGTGGGGTGGGGTGGSGGTRIPPSTPSPTTTSRQQPQYPTMPQLIYIEGRVMMDDGTPPPESILIERVCGTRVRPEGYTDSKGRFGFQLGQNTSVLAMGDASLGRESTLSMPGTQLSTTGPGMEAQTQLIGCELRARLPGYRPASVSLAGVRPMDNPSIGTLVLHRMGSVEGNSISMTSLSAPRDARKAFERGERLMRKSSFVAAQKDLEQAVALYPKFAAAWFELGRAYQSQDRPAEARNAYEQSLAADPRYLRPLEPMALLAMQEQKWEEVVRYTDKLLRLDPIDYNSAYLYNAIANLHLKKLDAAEKSVREGSKLDTDHKIPKLDYVMGIILANREDYPAAAQYLKSYLEREPGTPESATVRAQLAEIERRASLDPPGKP